MTRIGEIRYDLHLLLFDVCKKFYQSIHFLDRLPRIMEFSVCVLLFLERPSTIQSAFDNLV